MMMFEHFPDKWWWSLEKPLPSNRSSKKGKKKEKWTYSMYVANGEMFGSSTFMSVLVDADYIHSFYVEVLHSMSAKTLERIAALEKDKGDKKVLEFFRKQYEELLLLINGNDEGIKAT
jgi:hypothetical protein